jgi:hypothetical protein
VIVSDKGYFSGPLNEWTSQITKARTYHIRDKHNLTDSLLAYSPNTNYRIIPKLTIHTLANEVSIEDIVKNIEILKSYVAV